MSHLGTILKRAKTREQMGTGDAMFKQAITNMKEYMLLWRDFSDEEKKEADEFIRRYPDCVDRKLVSQVERDVERQQRREALEKLSNPKE